ncbi:MAG: methyltransferase, partial [Chitinivibrionales bacterium]|nr:methyltransferase [Chitinivibrionales bacterium]
MPTNNPFAFQAGKADLPALRESVKRIVDAGYTEDAVRRRLDLKDLCDLQMRAIPIYRKERLAGRTPLDIAIDLFLLQGKVPDAEAGRLLNKEDREALARTGVLALDGAGATWAAVSLYPVGKEPVFADHAWPQLYQGENGLAPFDQVMFIGADSRWLARATMRRPVHKALDLCTGSGIQALLAAPHAARVTAVDSNPRAVRCARFNARVLEHHNIEIMQGDCYVPLGEEKFDLITANPPFVPAPLDALGFRDGGHSGETVQRRIAAGLAQHLAPGGMAQMVTEVGERDGEALEVRIRQWLGGASMDMHVLRLRITPAEVYAVGHAQGDNPGAFLKSVDAWAGN